jgi:hypothetical protein
VIVEHRDRHVIHSGSAFVGGDLRERRNQCAFGVDLVDQAELLASFDPVFEGRQHLLCPNRRFDPAPAEQDLSGTCSPRGHCLRLFCRRFGHRVSAFLHPFALPALPGFFATMGALTPGRPALRLTREFPTPHRGDAVSVGYGVLEHPGKGFHPADSMQLQVHQGWVQPNELKSMSAGELHFAPPTLRRAASPVLGRCPRFSRMNEPDFATIQAHRISVVFREDGG